MLDVITILGVNAAIQHAKRKLYLFDKEILAVALDGTCTFDDGSDVMLEPEHLRDLKLQVQGRAPTFHAPKPMTTRDTQFAGFARALLKEMLSQTQWDGMDFNSDDEEEVEKYSKIIAQRAYDLAYHVMSQVTQGLAAENEIESSRKENMHYIDDLTELPEVSE